MKLRTLGPHVGALLASAACLLGLLPGPTFAQDQTAAETEAAPHGLRYEVWADVLFGPDGRNRAFHLPDEADYPAAFAAVVKQQLQAARVAIRTDEHGAPAFFRTGVRLSYLLLPKAAPDGADQLRFQGVGLTPLPVKRYLASYPKDVRQSSGWQGQVEASCRVSSEGLCGQIEVKMLPGMPESVRRFALASLQGWAFDAQRINDRPIEGEFKVNLALRTGEDMPKNFRIPAFERYMQGR